MRLDVGPIGSLPEQTESVVYRVAQEAVRNVVRHAHASAVELLVTQQDGWLQLTVNDDGRGFDPLRSARRRGSVGLDLLAALVHQWGGTLRVAPAAGQGTTVVAADRVPIRTRHDRVGATAVPWAGR